MNQSRFDYLNGPGQDDTFKSDEEKQEFLEILIGAKKPEPDNEKNK